MRTNKLSERIKDVDVVIDLMVHDIDLAIYFNGSVKNVFAFNKKVKNKIVFSSAVLEHKNGSFSRLVASRITEKKLDQWMSLQIKSLLKLSYFRKLL